MAGKSERKGRDLVFERDRVFTREIISMDPICLVVQGACLTSVFHFDVLVVSCIVVTCRLAELLGPGLS